MLWNTKEKGVFHFLLYREGDDYVAVCLNLNLVEYGEDPQELMNSIREAAFAHLGAVRKKKLSDSLLNIPASRKHWRKLKELQLQERAKPKVSSLAQKRLPKIKPEEVLVFQATQGYFENNFFDSAILNG